MNLDADIDSENYEWTNSTKSQFDWTPVNKFAIQLPPLDEYSLESLKRELGENVGLSDNKPRDFFNYAVIKSAYDADGGTNIAINDLTKLYADFATHIDPEVVDIVQQARSAMFKAHYQEFKSISDYDTIKTKLELEREVFEMNVARHEGREPDLDRLQGIFFDYKVQAVQNEVVNVIDPAVSQLITDIQNKMDELNRWTAVSEVEIPEIKTHTFINKNVPSEVDASQIDDPKQAPVAMPHSTDVQIPVKMTVQAEQIAKASPTAEAVQSVAEPVIAAPRPEQPANVAQSVIKGKDELLAEYRQIKYPTFGEAEAAIKNNIDDSHRPRNFLEQTQGMWVNVAPESRYKNPDTGEIIQLKTTGEMIAKNMAHHDIGSSDSKDQVAAQNVDKAVGIASQELRLTQQKETSKFDGNFHDLQIQEAKHKAEQTYFNVRYTELIDHKNPAKEKEVFQQAFTRYSQAKNADRIKEIEQMYPAAAKEITNEHLPTQTKVEIPHTVQLNMRPNRNGFTSVENVRERLAAYEARRKERILAIDREPMLEPIQSILAKEQAKQATVADKQAPAFDYKAEYEKMMANQKQVAVAKREQKSNPADMPTKAGNDDKRREAFSVGMAISNRPIGQYVSDFDKMMKQAAIPKGDGKKRIQAM